MLVFAVSPVDSPLELIEDVIRVGGISQSGFTVPLSVYGTRRPYAFLLSYHLTEDHDRGAHTPKR